MKKYKKIRKSILNTLTEFTNSVNVLKFKNDEEKNIINDGFKTLNKLYRNIKKSKSEDDLKKIISLSKIIDKD